MARDNYEPRGSIRIDDFRMGLVKNASPFQADTLTNWGVLRDGTLERRTGLNTAEVLLQTAGGAQKPQFNRNMFWHNRAALWYGGGDDNALYTADPAGAGTVTQQLAGAAYCPDRQTITDFPLDAMIYGHGWYNDAGTKRTWSINAAGTVSTFALPGNVGYRMRANSQSLTTASRVAASSAFLVSNVVSSATDTIGGIGGSVEAYAVYQEGFLIGFTDGTLKVFSGDYNGRRYDLAGNLAGEYFLPYAWDSTDRGVFFATTKSVYLYNGSIVDLTEPFRDSNTPFFETIPAANAALATLKWFEGRKELHFGFEDADSNWQWYIWSPAYGWRKFSATLFDNGSFGLKNGDLYISLKGYAPNNIPGIYLVYGTDKADPNGSIISTWRPGWWYPQEGRNYHMRPHVLYVEGDSLDATIPFAYIDLNGTAQSVNLTLEARGKAVIPSSVGIVRRCRPQITATVTTAQGTVIPRIRAVELVYSIEGRPH